MTTGCIKTSLVVTHTKAPKVNINPGTFNLDQSGSGVFATVQSIGTSEEDVDLTSLTSVGMVFLQNLDATNYVEWGKKDGSNNMQAIGRLGPTGGAGAFPYALFGFNGAITLRMKANTAACLVQIIAYEF